SSTGALAVVPAQGSVLAAQSSDTTVPSRLGSTVVNDDGSAALSIPPGALTLDAPIQLKALNIADFPSPGNGERLIGVVEGKPDGTHFHVAVRLRFSLTEKLEPGTATHLLIFNSEMNTWEPSEFAATVDESGHTASADVTHFTKFAAAASVSSVQMSSL